MTGSPANLTGDDLDRPTDLSLAVADHLVQFINGRRRVGESDWRRAVEKYLAHRPLWEVVILRDLSQHIEDIVSGLRQPTPDVSMLSRNWLHTDESTRKAWLVHRLLGLIAIDRGQEDQWMGAVEDLARQELNYRQAIDDRPGVIPEPLGPLSQMPVGQAENTPKPSRRRQRKPKRINLNSLAQRLPPNFSARDASEIFGTGQGTTYNWLRRLRDAGLVDRNSNGWFRIDKAA